ncbi:homeodomain-like/winged-helix DNA-binding family protein [Wolffia australiana]
MGAPKQKWTAEEEEALRAGVEKHGAGKWRTIQRDPDFSRCLASRSNIDLKDKWRNMSLCGGQGSREKPRVPRIKAPPGVSFPGSQAPFSAPAKLGALAVTPDISKISQEQKNSPRYNTMILEALSNVREPQGMDVGSICSYIEHQNDVPPNFRRLLGPKLRRLVAQNKIEKVERGYRLREAFITKTPAPREKEAGYHPRHLLSSSPSMGSHPEAMRESSPAAAYKISEAEAKSYLASEAVKEAERVAKLAEETDSMLIVAQDIFEQCSRGEVLIVV